MSMRPRESSDDCADSRSPGAYMQDMAGQLLLVRAIGVAAELGIADLVTSGPQTIDGLAAATGAHADSLYRLLRMLGGHGVFAEDETGRIVLTPRAELLRSDHPHSMRDSFSLAWQNVHWDTFRELPAAVMQGDIAFDRAFGEEFFNYLAAHPAANAVFDRRMAAVARAENPPIAAAMHRSNMPLEPGQHVIDVGGGQGGLLAAILSVQPDIEATLYEQPQVLADPADLATAGLLERVALVAGDFFADVPQAADWYLLKRIIHDWDDLRATHILRNCRAAMAPGSRIAVIDAVMRPGNDPDPNKNLDLGIMALTPGKERTEAEFRTLFAAAGLRVTQILPTEAPSTVSIIEGEPADL